VLAGAKAWTDDNLGANSATKCDSRLSKKQALELAFFVAENHGSE
jgi:3-deoxy-D-arabino-heptulosonate 7-phosphate (DAHP) synthase class II